MTYVYFFQELYIYIKPSAGRALDPWYPGATPAWRSGLGGWSTAASVADLRSPVLLGWRVVPQRRVPRPSWHTVTGHPAIGYCLVKRLGRWLGRWFGRWLGEVSSIGWRMWWRWLFTGRWFSRGRCEFTGRIRKVIWSNMVMGPIWRQSQASSEWPIDVWEPPSLIHFWRANIHGKCRWDIFGYIFCDATYSKIFQEYSQQCSQFYSGEVIIQRNSTEMNIQLLLPS